MTNTKNELDSSGNIVYQNIRTVLVTARQKVYSAINSAMVEAYWEIGRQIEQAVGDRAEYGKGLLQYISKELSIEFGKGFTVRNLQAMRQFYEVFPNTHALRAELSWTHFVVIDLKTGKLSYQDIGQIDFYVRYFDDKIKLSEDNPTLGIILCADKNETMAKYSILSDKDNLLASKYMLYLPTEEELKNELERERARIESKQKDDNPD